jgi:uridine phosphorylase
MRRITNLNMMKCMAMLAIADWLFDLRLDSAYGSDLYTEKDKMEWLQRLQDMGVTNIEMEAPEFAAFCKRMNVPALLICVTLLNRMEGDQVLVSASCC